VVGFGHAAQDRHQVEHAFIGQIIEDLPALAAAGDDACTP